MAKIQIEFWTKEDHVRTLIVDELPGLAVGQKIEFDHTSPAMCLHGRVTEISHVFASYGSAGAYTYVNVELEDDIREIHFL